MAEKEKKQGFMDKLYKGLGFVSQIISSSLLSPVIDGAEIIMDKVEKRMALMEKRILRRLSALFITSFGAVFLIFAVLFFLIEQLKWSKSLAFFAIGIIIFVIGLLFKVRNLLNEKENR